jgi:hypothetical protein
MLKLYLLVFLLMVLEEYEKYELVLSQPRHIYTTIDHKP